MSEGRAYWDVSIDRVPGQTGAAHVLDASDLRDALDKLAIPLPLGGPVLDVGCGTGRLAQLVANRETYLGLDIAPGCVAYTRQAGLAAELIDGPRGLQTVVADRLFRDRAFAWITCCSVFTHIDQDEREAYLRAFSGLAPRVVVDIIPGNGEGGIAIWTCRPDALEHAAQAANWRVVGYYDRLAPDRTLHRYYRLVSAAFGPRLIGE